MISFLELFRLFLLDVTMTTEEQIGSHVMTIKNCLETCAVRFVSLAYKILRCRLGGDSVSEVAATQA